MTNQDLVNTRQTSINKRQTNVNDDQNIINDQTKIDLSMRNFWAIIVLCVSVTIATTTGYLVNNFKIASDIRDINTNITYIKNGLEKHLSDSEQARRDMKIVAKGRDDKFNEIDKKISGIEAILKIR